MMLSMRPIHRPIHDLTVLPDVWDKMTAEEQQEATAQGKLRFPVRRQWLRDDLNGLSLFNLE
jgi:hypothetical protein